MTASEWLGEADRRKIAQAVAEAEKRTSGEIVVAVATASDRYPHVDYLVILGSTVLGVALGTFGSFPSLPPAAYATATALAGMFVGAFILVPFVPDAVRRMLAGDAKMDEEVRQRAVELFYTHKLPRTARRTGVLLFLSLLERRVVVWADEGVAEKLGPPEWSPVVDAAGAALRVRDPGDALSGVIKHMGDLLAKELPPSGDNPDEISNDVILID